MVGAYKCRGIEASLEWEMNYKVAFYGERSYSYTLPVLLPHRTCEVFAGMSYSLSVRAVCAEPYLGPSLAQVCPGSQFLTFMTLLDALVRSQESISQTCERIKPVNPPEYYYDFIVVGGE
ncbi:Glucose dehydrogenase [acceptor] [Camponotus floridanus]|uniref:Glucose dehydrogenase [acceptor] n=1 Tax=Camponotus floridanus TaxID=104421 RepID=E2AC29_CAMFO|nr:Glucose dehydrogenase [acceptor] [Camponotus floridanus]